MCQILIGDKYPHPLPAVLSAQVLYLSPPLEHARAAWIHQFHAYLHTAAGLPRLRSKSFAVLGVSSRGTFNLNQALVRRWCHWR